VEGQATLIVSVRRLPSGGWPSASIPAQTVSLYVEQGSSVDLGAKYQLSPRACHLPAVLGASIGEGESGATGSDSRTRRRAVPSPRLAGGRAVTFVLAAGLAGPGAGSAASGAGAEMGLDGGAGVAAAGADAEAARI
jgi:hypothetical protein